MGFRDTKLIEYFNQGYSYNEILVMLKKNHDITLSLRQLKRDLKRFRLYRRKSNCSFTELCEVVQDELKGSGKSLGYRSMHQKLKTVHGIQTSRSTTAEIQKLLDPEGVAERKAKRLSRRRYINKGPNYLWHIDGYDKLKKYGFCIHGCIDGYSRKLLWLECSSTNNCPKAVAFYYLKHVELLSGTARVIRSDGGSENLNIAAMQRFFRINHNDSMAGTKSFRFGKSTSNQRIEAYWSQLRRWFTQWWMNYFKDMRDDGSYDECDSVHCESLKFCYGVVIQKELDQITTTHNMYRIRSQPNQEVPGGRPNILYDVPELTGGVDCKYPVSQTDIRQSYRYVVEKGVFCCSNEFQNLALAIMANDNLSMPKTFTEARLLYDHLIDAIETIENTV